MVLSLCFSSNIYLNIHNYSQYSQSKANNSVVVGKIFIYSKSSQLSKKLLLLLSQYLTYYNVIIYSVSDLSQYDEKAHQEYTTIYNHWQTYKVWKSTNQHHILVFPKKFSLKSLILTTSQVTIEVELRIRRHLLLFMWWCN